MFNIAKKIIPEHIKSKIKVWHWRSDLCKLAVHFGTDKWGTHRYAQHYQTHFAPLKKAKIRILEIGVGGHDSPTLGGASLRMWKAFFPNAHIYAIDIFDKSALQESRITILQGSQNDPNFLLSVIEQFGPFDIVIDDGSHVNEHVLTSFDVLFPLIHHQGVYVIEDMQTAYWEEFGGSENPHDPNISTAIVKGVVDGLNWEEYRVSPPALGRDIVALHCYHNIVFIQKGENREGSNKDKQHKVHT